ncbi:MAG: RES family NAD+ phosphorylase [Thermoanaerobaculia bacterium]
MKARYAGSAFTGEGARRVGGRWHSPGAPVVYTSASRALAMLEVLVNLTGAARQDLPACVLIWAGFSEHLIEELPPRDLPTGWDAAAGSPAARVLGDTWLASKRSAVLRVPSVIVPGELNFLLNPLHSSFPQVHIGDPVSFAWDPRLAGDRT